MRRRTLDVMVSAAGLVVAVLLVAVGFVLVERSTFSDNYVRDQLTQQSITFPKAETLQPKETEFTEARSGCVLEYAGQAVTTGKQAECYANEYLGGHLTWLATRLGMTQVAYVDGMNYRELGGELGKLRGDITAAEKAGASNVAALQQQLADVTTVRQKMFEGTMLRNALLTSYGFSQLGDMAGVASKLCFGAAALLVVLGLAGLLHARRTPLSQAFAPPESAGLTARVPTHA